MLTSHLVILSPDKELFLLGIVDQLETAILPL
jgi:hypothetical protein